MRNFNEYSSTESNDETSERSSMRLAVYALVGCILGALVGAADSLSLNDTFTALLTFDFATIMNGLTAKGGGVPALAASIVGAGCAVMLAYLSSAGPVEGPLKPRTFP